jgi:hypothetical protein
MHGIRCMRTTLDVDDDVLQAAKEIAFERADHGGGSDFTSGPAWIAGAAFSKERGCP